LESAILNLTVNARDAMPWGGTLTIETGEGHAGPGEGLLPVGQPVVFIRVADTGEGMTREVLERAFEPFFTTKEVGKGSGLGLSMVYGFAQQSGGHVAIRSEPGQGTTVTILLPALACAALPVPAPVVAEAPQALRRERILVVEDEEPVLQFVSAQLTSLGYEVTGVSTGPDALALLRRPARRMSGEGHNGEGHKGEGHNGEGHNGEGPLGAEPPGEEPAGEEAPGAEGMFDLLFTDVVLPRGMSGVELARQARGLRPGLKVLLTSGYPEETFEHHGRPEAGTRLLRKPYRRRDLAQSIKDALGIA
jgi:CheY-like chemotaxis protein